MQSDNNEIFQPYTCVLKLVVNIGSCSPTMLSTNRNHANRASAHMLTNLHETLDSLTRCHDNSSHHSCHHPSIEMLHQSNTVEPPIMDT